MGWWAENAHMPVQTTEWSADHVPVQALGRGVRRALGSGSAGREDRGLWSRPVQRGRDRARRPCQLVCTSQATRGGLGAADRMRRLLIWRPSAHTCLLWLWSMEREA